MHLLSGINCLSIVFAWLCASVQFSMLQEFRLVFMIEHDRCVHFVFLFCFFPAEDIDNKSLSEELKSRLKKAYPVLDDDQRDPPEESLTPRRQNVIPKHQIVPLQSQARRSNDLPAEEPPNPRQPNIVPSQRFLPHQSSIAMSPVFSNSPFSNGEISSRFSALSTSSNPHSSTSSDIVPPSPLFSFDPSQSPTFRNNLVTSPAYLRHAPSDEFSISAPPRPPKSTEIRRKQSQVVIDDTDYESMGMRFSDLCLFSVLHVFQITREMVSIIL